MGSLILRVFIQLIYVPLNDYDIECIQKAKEIIITDLSDHYNIELLATMVNLGKTKLKAGFQLCYGMGLYRFLKKERMKKASELLVETDRTIKQIAHSIGFKHASNFTKAFGTYHGLTPGNYRKYFPRK